MVIKRGSVVVTLVLALVGVMAQAETVTISMIDAPEPMVIVEAVPLSMSVPDTHAGYWTPRRKWETVAVTSLHLVDAGLTCYRMESGNYQSIQNGLVVGHSWTEHFPLTPDNCAGAAVAIIGEGVVVQAVSYEMAKHWAWWKSRGDRGVVGVEIGLSAAGIWESSRP